MNFRKLFERIKDFLRSPLGKTVLKWFQRLFLLTILVWLIYQLSNIGWNNVWRSLPTQGAFYLLFLLLYFQLPFFEVIVYRVVWRFPVLKAIPVFLLKRVYNSDLLGYSGEVYLYMWARKQLHLADRKIFMVIKDINIISSIASTIVAFGLLSVFLFTDQIKVIEWIIGQHDIYFWGGSVLMIVIALLFIRFRQFVISMPLKSAYRIFSIHFFRLILLQAINVMIYYVVIPDAPLYVWFTLISVEIILTRIPFLPNRDLIFVGMSIGIAQGFVVSQSDIAGVVVARAAMGKLFNLISFGLATAAQKKSVIPGPGEEDPENGNKTSERPD